MWGALGLDMTEHRGAYTARPPVLCLRACKRSRPRPDPARAQVRNTDAVFAALEESSVSLSAMAASRAADAFREDVSHWERTLAGVSETLERVLQARGRAGARMQFCRRNRPLGWRAAPGCAAQVQARWMYLDAIFGGSEEVRRLLPADAARFDAAAAAFRGAGAALHASRASAIQVRARAAPRAAPGRQRLGLVQPCPNRVSPTLTLARRAARARGAQACAQDGLLGTLAATAAELERVRGALEGYLDAKRAAFPRFHFLASDDLLDVLGPGRDPRAVQPHLWKCFEGARPARARARSRAPGSAAPDARAARAQASGSWTCTRRARTAGARTRSPARLRPTASICPSWRPSRRTARPSSGSRASRRPCSPP